ncbi:hypothetical protein NC651_034815 [Populus alba x Populus x berolinensis]|nr:hypothetical protein NC651_034815 [Populus alba x Populus x berolinensis]
MKVENECKAPEQHRRSSSDFYREGREVQENKKSEWPRKCQKKERGKCKVAKRKGIFPKGEL